MLPIQSDSRLIQTNTTKPHQTHRSYHTMFRNQPRSRSSLLTATGLVALAIASASGASAGFVAAIAPYTVPVSPDYSIVPILSVGDRVPRTSNLLQQFQMVGIPDG